MATRQINHHTRQTTRQTLETITDLISTKPGKGEQHARHFQERYLQNPRLRFPITFYERTIIWNSFHEAHGIALEVLSERGVPIAECAALHLEPAQIPRDPTSAYARRRRSSDDHYHRRSRAGGCDGGETERGRSRRPRSRVPAHRASTEASGKEEVGEVARVDEGQGRSAKATTSLTFRSQEAEKRS
ncbi:hypothetical protein BU16DRAFT_620481 [Lophium mytilinum]|uniref:Uncharacterized protein n=1 Tax=Lophium mytilinum TaxID=390894 RepID=A0A6A6QMB6_9PEZI|nr:hypothetical protein BU16DRAFT_620481 [Lophium mytilinum]